MKQWKNGVNGRPPKKKKTTADLLTDRDMKALFSIYKHRFLTLYQVYLLNYKEGVNTDAYCRRKMRMFEKEGLIEKEPMFNKIPDIYFLTKKGVTMIKDYYKFPRTIVDEKGYVKRGYKTSSEIKVKPTFINHQHHLNSFITPIELNLKGFVPYRYTDEKHITQTAIRPDGILTIKDSVFFLEMDMGTENERVLKEKWTHYRAFLNSSYFTDHYKKVVMLFITEGRKKMDQRQDLIRKTIMEEMFDLINNKTFEVYIGTSKELTDLCYKRLINESIGDLSYLKDDLRELFSMNHFKISEPFGMFEDGHPHAIIQNEKEEFIVFDYSFKPLSVLRNIFYYENLTRPFKKKFQKSISPIIVFEQEKDIVKDLKLVGNPTFLYCTTKKHLREKGPFYKKLFYVDATGNMFGFEDEKREKLHFIKSLVAKK